LNHEGHEEHEESQGGQRSGEPARADSARRLRGGGRLRSQVRRHASFRFPSCSSCSSWFKLPF